MWVIGCAAAMPCPVSIKLEVASMAHRIEACNKLNAPPAPSARSCYSAAIYAAESQAWPQTPAQKLGPASTQPCCKQQLHDARLT